MADAPAVDDTSSRTDASKTLAENLYKRGLDIAAKNKTLVLLSKLYEISILALQPKELAERVSNTIRENLSFELVGIFLYDEDKKSVAPVAFSSSERLMEVQEHFKVLFSSIPIPTDHAFISRVIKERTYGYSEQFDDLWQGSLSPEMIAELESGGHVKSLLAYPLVSGNEVIGILLFGMNRPYDQLLEHEKESITSFTNVVAVALDKALLDEQLKVANNKLRELDRLKSEFLSIASHQLRAPITAIRGYTANISDGTYGEVPENFKKPLETIQETSRLMVNSIEDYLNISRIEQGSMKYEKGKLDVADLAKKVVNELSPIAAVKNLEIKTSIPQDLIIVADTGKIKQVITNLVDNAIKYTEQGSVTVSVSEVDTKARITISDTGVGIPADEIGGLFEKFKRARGANEVNTTGTGLGLYVAKQLVEGHGGKVWAESDGAGKGTRFIVELPIDLKSKPS